MRVVGTGRDSRPPEDGWTLTYRPKRMPRIALTVAAAVIAVHVVVGVLLRVSDTGVRFRVTDQIGLAAIGVVIGAAIATFARPRVRMGDRGIEVRNLGGERLFRWVDVRGIWYPDSGRWARLELPGDDYVPVMAIQAGDGPRAVAAMDEFRDLHASHTVPTRPTS